MLTKDSVTVSVDAAVYFRTKDPIAAISCIVDSTLSTKQLAQTTLRNILGTRTLTEIMLEREGISKVIQVSGGIVAFHTKFAMLLPFQEILDEGKLLPFTPIKLCQSVQAQVRGA